MIEASVATTVQQRGLWKKAEAQRHGEDKALQSLLHDFVSPNTLVSGAQQHFTFLECGERQHSKSSYHTRHL